MRILINDGMHPKGVQLLKDAGHDVDTNFILQEELTSKLNSYDAVLVRSATKIRKELIDQSPNLKLIGRGGVGLDNIDVSYAKEKGIAVFNTPAASTRSVAELAIAHLFGIVRSLPMVNKKMAVDGINDFKSLKKTASKGIELEGKTLGLIGFGRIAKETASIALGCGMKIIAFDPYISEGDVSVKLHPSYDNNYKINVKTTTKGEVLAESDFISLHIPGGQGYVLDVPEFEQMKDGVGIVNCARGGTISENALIEAINSEKVKYVATDVFENEPPTDDRILRIDNVGLSPHIGASTQEAQERVGVQLAKSVIEYFS
ncbi:MAG: D-2-hydroxyacid dehydrogenase [Bacteroidia bacterium]|nr:D-2-hydroxyacid dehydrogenase [Bacteroidia bacterium]MDG2041379.1 D-2-hydroxyacid dehydrogenase [Bacteroidia bacterium]|tara:strand:+ start:2120 stop:3070 length:951 start_codon:yes stop_codon:yes gene_type:complete